jgi:hypothetical protein
MTGTPEKQNPGWRAGASGMSANGLQFHAQSATAAPLLQRVEGVQKTGNGWRARCPACGGTSRKLSITETESRVLVHCFGCGDAGAVLDAVGLRWADLMPPRTWPESPDERRKARRAMREAGWSAALATLAVEAKIIAIAAGDLIADKAIEWDDYVRLVAAGQRIDSAANVLIEAVQWRPEVRA